MREFFRVEKQMGQTVAPVVEVIATRALECDIFYVTCDINQFSKILM